jgi:hypothetical protein
VSGTYAIQTSVSVEKSRGEIEKTLSRYGATAFMYGWNEGGAIIQFAAHGRLVKFILRLPDKDADEFRLTPAGRSRRTDADAERAWEQACRQKWRALALVVKAKLEAVDAGIAIFEDEFLAYTVLPGGETVGAWLQPQINEAYANGVAPRMLLELGDGS